MEYGNVTRREQITAMLSCGDALFSEWYTQAIAHLDHTFADLEHTFADLEHTFADLEHTFTDLEHTFASLKLAMSERAAGHQGLASATFI
jgi:hypothetical protein